jgi:hypothetical protein
MSIAMSNISMSRTANEQGITVFVMNKPNRPNSFKLTDNNWTPYRPTGSRNIIGRIKSAFMVLTCKADVVVWGKV